jgi:lipopolysaccharide cholinephosphotransferase
MNIKKSVIFRTLAIVCMVAIMYTMLKDIKSLEGKIQRVTERIEVTTDITKVPQAKGILRDIQKIQLIMLKEFDKICRKHNLRYWLDYGTLIGTVRHKGFIPWDDDVDVCMPFEDYRKFVAIAQNELPNEMLLTQCRKKGSAFSKIAFQISNFGIKGGKNCPIIAMDIFPYHFVTEAIANNPEYIQTLRKKVEDYARKNGNDKANTLYEKLTKTFSLPEGKDSDCMILGLEWVWSGNYVHRYDEIFPLKEGYFEGCKFYIPNNPDATLMRVYGDFWQFPTNTKGHFEINKIDVDYAIKIRNYLNKLETAIEAKS